VSALWFPDNTVLCNFGAVQRLDLLKYDLAERGRWTAAVEFEVGRSARVIPALHMLINEAWLGDAVETTEDEAAAVDRIRVAEFGGTTTEPLKHLGEAETCHVIRSRVEFQGSVWITDDVAAFSHGQRLGITTWSTRTVVEHLIADGEIDEQGGFDLLTEMEAADRHVLYMPNRPTDLR
jgi:hypothetical protein